MQIAARTAAWAKSGDEPFVGIKITVVVGGDFMSTAVNVSSLFDGRTSFHVDWGDGTNEDFNSTGIKSHVYASAGEYEVKVSDDVLAFPTYFIFDGFYPVQKTYRHFECSMSHEINLGNNAFRQSETIESIAFNSQVTFDNVGNAVFYLAANLAEIKCIDKTPPALTSNSFYFNTSLQKIIVPFESVDAYKSATGWKNYASKIIAMET